MTKLKKKQMVGFEDKRGILVFANKELLDFNYEYLTIGTINPGSMRGGHYHKRIEEKLLCLTGQITFMLDDEIIKLIPGDMVDIPPFSTHTLINEGRNVASFIEFKSENFNREDDDTYRH